MVFLSKSLNETERNYEIYDKEMLVIIKGLENWRHLLEGAHFKFRVVEEMKKVKVKELWENEWQIEGDLMLKEGKMYMLENKELRVEIIQLHHDVLVAGHGG